MSIFAITQEGLAPLRLIFELDRDIHETKLCKKFHRDLPLLSKVNISQKLRKFNEIAYSERRYFGLFSRGALGLVFFFL